MKSYAIASLDYDGNPTLEIRSRNEILLEAIKWYNVDELVPLQHYSTTDLSEESLLASLSVMGVLGLNSRNQDGYEDSYAELNITLRGEELSIDNIHQDV